MTAPHTSELPWGTILAISVVAFVAVKLLTRTGWINVILLPILGPLAMGKLMIFSALGRTRPYWDKLSQSEEVSNSLVINGKTTRPEAGVFDPVTNQIERKHLASIVERWNKGHRWFESSIQLATRDNEIIGFCRLFTIPKALGIGADKRVYRDIERVVEFMKESSRELGISWNVTNTMGLTGKVEDGAPDAELVESMAILARSVFWRRRKSEQEESRNRPSE